MYLEAGKNQKNTLILSKAEAKCAEAGLSLYKNTIKKINGFDDKAANIAIQKAIVDFKNDLGISEDIEPGLMNRIADYIIYHHSDMSIDYVRDAFLRFITGEISTPESSSWSKKITPYFINNVISTWKKSIYSKTEALKIREKNPGAYNETAEEREKRISKKNERENILLFQRAYINYLKDPEKITNIDSIWLCFLLFKEEKFDIEKYYKYSPEYDYNQDAKHFAPEPKKSIFSIKGQKDYNTRLLTKMNIKDSIEIAESRCYQYIFNYFDKCEKENINAINII